MTSEECKSEPEYDYYPSYLDSPVLVLKQSQIAEMLKHKTVLVGVKSEGTESMVNFQVPPASAEMRSSCGLN